MTVSLVHFGKFQSLVCYRDVHATNHNRLLFVTHASVHAVWSIIQGVCGASRLAFDLTYAALLCVAQCDLTRSVLVYYE